MIRNLKALGLALVAVFALSALVASAASAQQGVFTTSDGTAKTLIGTETGAQGSGVNALTAFGSKVECASNLSKYTGHKFNVTPHVAVPNKEKTFTLTPHYVHCHTDVPLLGTRTATVTMNGCDYVLHIGVTTGGVAGTYGTTVDIVCPANKVIEVHVYNSGTATTNHVEVICTIKVKPQVNLAGPHLTNTGGVPDDVDLFGTFKPFTVEREGSCLVDGKGTKDEKAEFHADVTIKASDGTGITVSDTP